MWGPSTRLHVLYQFYDLHDIWSHFDIEAKGFIPIVDLEFFILRVVERELQLKSQPNLASNFLFNLHKDKFLRLYAIWKLKLRCSDEEQR